MLHKILWKLFTWNYITPSLIYTIKSYCNSDEVYGKYLSFAKTIKDNVLFISTLFWKIHPATKETSLMLEILVREQCKDLLTWPQLHCTRIQQLLSGRPRSINQSHPYWNRNTTLMHNLQGIQQFMGASIEKKALVFCYTSNQCACVSKDFCIMKNDLWTKYCIHSITCCFILFIFISRDKIKK